MPPRSPIIAFLAASPFELLDLTGPAAVFAYPTLKDKPYYSFRILSTASGDSVKSMGGLSIGDTSRFSEYAGPIDTLIVVGGLGSIGYQSPELLEWLRKHVSRIRRACDLISSSSISVRQHPEGGSPTSTRTPSGIQGASPTRNPAPL